MEKHAIRDRFEDEEDLSSPRRRSSAEGKIALLKEPSSDDNMDSWTVSVGSHAAAHLGSSQERSEEADEEEDVAYTSRRREYREQAPPPREGEGGMRASYASSSEVTSVEEDSDVAGYNFVLTKDSRKKSLQDLSKLSRDDSDLTESGWNVVRQDSGEGLARSSSTGLYKRESIIRSQASEEDPEYLVVERPKLVQQEREHPFKKAWQMQKSRSEEDGSAAYTIKEPKEQQSKTETAKSRDGEDPPSREEVKKEGGGEQYEDTGAFPDDDSELTHSRSSDTEEYTTRSSRSEGAKSSSTERSKSFESNKFGLRSSDVEEDSSRSNWPSEDEQVYKTSPRSKLEETEWIWEREET